MTWGNTNPMYSIARLLLTPRFGVMAVAGY
jgi:hypothetical protein